MKILLFEDDAASIESAKLQFRGHKLNIVTTCFELFEMFKDGEEDGDILKKFDLILTDMNVRRGKPNSTWPYSVLDHTKETELFPAGLILALRARESDIPCLLLTDSNSHRDMLGLMLDDLTSMSFRKSGRELHQNNTRPSWIKTHAGRGKDWLREVKRNWPDLIDTRKGKK